MRLTQVNKKSAVILLAFIVSGCASQQNAERQLALSQATQSCKVKFPAGAHAHTADRVMCISNAQNSVMRQFVAYPDLLNLQQQYDLSLAQSVDAGNLSIQDAALKQAETKTRLQTIFEQRRNACAIADAQTDEATYSGLALIQANRPVTTNCYRIGNSTNCSTR